MSTSLDFLSIQGIQYFAWLKQPENRQHDKLAWINTSTWMVQDKLQLNDAKTEFLIIGTRTQLNKVTINDLQVGEVKVSAVHSDRNLGAWFDANMNMTTHINSICQSIYYNLHNIRRIRKYLSYDIGSPLYRLLYCHE